ncbi:Cleavage induced Predicted protein [Phytophthora palmivora]|uniref:Uncharacterized protein n=1 Tax=Phytophthora palmivora TaxID=4796 RepID=A0A2P4X5A4_9STRA|nr:Cleavage induced Predicted protein [Phytophthora palmivora]
MPSETIEKAIRRLRDLDDCTKMTRNHLIRHVVICIPVAAPFFTHMAAISRRAPRVGYVQVTKCVKEDIRWFELILKIGRLNTIPLTGFTRRHEPGISIYMDPCNQEELKLIHTFTLTGGNEFCIDVRELMRAVFPAIAWGSLEQFT